MSKKRLFLKYIFKYLILFFIVLMCCIPIVMRAYELAEKNVMDQNTIKLESGMDDLKEHISKMYSMFTIINQDIYITSLRDVYGALPLQEYVYMIYLQKQMFNMNLLHDFSAYNFMLFAKNDIYVSNSQVSSDFSNYYRVFLQGDNLNEKEFYNKIFQEDKSVSFIQFDKLKYFKNGAVVETNKPIVCSVKTNSDYQVVDNSAVMVFVIERRDILNLLLTADSIENGFIRLTDATGRTLLSYGADAEELPKVVDKSELELNGTAYKVISDYNQTYGLTAVVGVSESVINEQIRGIVGMVRLYACLGIVLVVCISLVLSYCQYIPVRNLINLVSTENNNPITADNEYDFIQKSLLQIATSKNEYKAKLNLLDSQMRASMLENLFVRGIYTEEEKKEFEQNFSLPIEYFCVAILHVNSEDKKNYLDVSLQAGEYLRKNFQNDFISVHSGIYDELFLILLRPQDASNVYGIQQNFEQMAQILTEEWGVILNIGISAIGKDINNINICYNQARQVLKSYYSENANHIGAYSSLIRNTSQNIVDMEYIQKLYNLILCGEKEAVKGVFEHTLNKCNKFPLQYEMQCQQLFYSIRHIIYCTYQELSFSTDKVALPTYRNHWSVNQAIEALEKAALEVCNCIEENKKSKNTQLKNNILTYLQENYMSIDLNAAMVCQKIGISEKYLLQFIKEQTGKTFVGYVEELRIAKAEEYLRSTVLSNAVIAEKTGFGSVNTFYRVFNKNKGISPGIYRENFKN